MEKNRNLKIIVIGDAASGKTTMVKLIAHILETFNINCVVNDLTDDDYAHELNQINVIDGMKRIQEKTNISICEKQTISDFVNEEKSKNNKYDVGDVVFVKNIKPLGYGNGICESMSKYFNRKVTITKVYPHGSYRIKEDKGRYFWKDNMFYDQNIEVDWNGFM